MNKDFIKFIEDYYGIKLTTYQKTYLKFLTSKGNIMINTRIPYKQLVNNLMIEYNKAMKNDFCIATPNGIEEYKNGELVSIKNNKIKTKYKVLLDEFK